MKKTSIIIFVLAVFILSSCSKTGPQGDLVGVGHGADWFEPDPFGMVFIPQGSYNMGPNDQDVPFAYTAQSKTVSIDPFWMDETEITNSEYKQFVFWVRDSIARRLLVSAEIEGYKKDIDEEVYTTLYPSYDHEDNDKCFLNWEKEIEWNKAEEEYQGALREMFLEEHEMYYEMREIDTRKLIYEYKWVDLRQAAKKQNRYNYKEDFSGGEYNGTVTNSKGEIKDIEHRGDFVMHKKINVYPDTLVWMQDYTYSYN